MSTYSDLWQYLAGSGWEGSLDAQRGRLLALCSAYEALEPDWSQIDNWVQWVAVDLFGVKGFDTQPELCGAGWGGGLLTTRMELLRCHKQPLAAGLDFRECLWQRP